ncbi:M48 family metalloprotease [Rhodocaloribacter sp.]
MFHVKRLSRLLRAALLAAILPAFLSGCVATRDVNPITGHTRFYGYSWEQELKIGAESDPQIVAQFGVYDDEALAEYVRRVGETVLRHSHLRRPDADPRFRNLTFTFRVLDSPVVNAFALPGGYVYVTRGLLAHLENEAQLAVVLGHEIGHVAGRHASKRAASQSFLQLGLITGALVGQGVFGGNTAERVLNLGGTGLQLLFLSYGRGDEREADDVGVEYAALAGYEAGEAARFFRTLKRLGERSGQSLPGFLSTHPDPGEREQTILRLASEWKQRTAMTKVDEDAYLSRIDGIVLGENPRQGFTRSGMFYHPDLRFRFSVPAGFQVVNQPTQVTMVADEQRAIILFTLEQKAETAKEAAARFGEQRGLTVVESGTSRAGGNPASFVVADAQTSDGRSIRLLAFFIDYGGNVYTFLGYTLASAYSAYEGVFYRTMQSFSALVDPAVLAVQPIRVAVVPAGRTAAFHTFVPASAKLPKGWDAERMAILNQVERDEVIPQGKKLKLTR